MRLVVVVVLSGLPLFGGPATTERPDNRKPDGARDSVADRSVRRGLVTVVPEVGTHANAADRGDPFLLQLRGLPTVKERTRLRDLGIELLEFVGAGTYIARCDRDSAGVLAGLPSVRSVIDLEPGMKMSSVFDSDPELGRRLRSGSALEVSVRFFDRVGFADARAALSDAGIDVTQDRFGFRRTLVVEASAQALDRLSRSPEVAWIDPALPPAGPSLKNAAERSRVDQVRGSPSYLGADGSGTRVGVVDWFPEAVHADLEGRVTDAGVRWGESDHGVTVSGAIAGSGSLDSRATGMAPAAQLFWTSWVAAPWPEFRRLHDEYGVTIISNSWNVKPGWWTSTRSWHGDLWAFGYYHEWAAAADTLVRDDGLLVVFSAGNKRDISFLGPHTHGDHYGSEDGIQHEDLHPPNPTYTSIAGTAIAKNVLTVGGTTKEDEVVYFSSWGPTADGRIKPEVVAVGLEVFTTAADDGYEVTGGTSISAPVVAGIAALLSDLAWRAHGIELDSSLLKGLLIHSARDVDAPGPDYRSGFGMVDAELAARVLDAAVFDGLELTTLPRVRRRLTPPPPSPPPAPTTLRVASSAPSGIDLSSINRGTLDQGQVVVYELPVPSDVGELRATLVWHDPPSPFLVNDLDLRFVAPDGKIVLPFVLDPSTPSAAAVQGVNHRDPVEHVRVDAPQGGLWRVVVDGAAVADGPQEYTLVASAGEGNRQPLRPTNGDFEITDFFMTVDPAGTVDPQPTAVFHDGDALNLYARFSVHSNADYGDYFGSITLTLRVEDGSGTTVARWSNAGHNVGPVDWRGVLDFGVEVPSGLPLGSYTAHFVLDMPNGQRRTSEYQFTVD